MYDDGTDDDGKSDYDGYDALYDESRNDDGRTTTAYDGTDDDGGPKPDADNDTTHDGPDNDATHDGPKSYADYDATDE